VLYRLVHAELGGHRDDATNRLPADAVTAAVLMLAALVAAAPSDLELAKDSFLRSYVEQLKKETPARQLERMKTMAADELILLHHGYLVAPRLTWHGWGAHADSRGA